MHEPNALHHLKRYCIILVHTLKHLMPGKCVINITYRYYHSQQCPLIKIKINQSAKVFSIERFLLYSKSSMRPTMTQTRLNHLMILHYHQNLYNQGDVKHQGGEPSLTAWILKYCTWMGNIPIYHINSRFHPCYTYNGHV